MTSIYNKILIRCFYREQAGFFLFVFLLFFGIVQPSTQLYFHYALIRGILAAPAFMGLVALAWLLYGLRVRRFIVSALEAPDALFLHKSNAGPPGRVARQCAGVSIVLFLPVIGYALAIGGVAITQHSTGKALGLVAFLVALITLTAAEMRHRLRYPGVVAVAAGSSIRRYGLIRGIFVRSRPSRPAHRVRHRVPYWSILLRFLLAETKGILAATKIFSCSMLYLLLRIQTPDDYDLRMPFLTYSLALFGHGILLYRCRRLETVRLLFYRALPVPRIRRFGEYALFCFLLLLPEMLLLGRLTPHPLKPADSFVFIILGYGILLLLHGILNIWTLAVADYLKLCLIMLGLLYCLVLTIWRPG